MGDPLSAAGTAVGIASLGIKVCEDLIAYVNSIRARKAEIAEALEEVKRLLSLFYHIESILPKLDPRVTGTATIRTCLEAIGTKLGEFQALLIKLQGHRPAVGTKERTEELFRSLIYPLKKGKLTDLSNAVQNLLSELNPVLDSVALAYHVEHHSQLGNIETAVADVAASSKDSFITQNDRLDTVNASIETLSISSQVQNDGLKESMAQHAQGISDQIQTLGPGITKALRSTQQSSATHMEWTIRDAERNISGKLDMIAPIVQEILDTRKHHDKTERMNEVMKHSSQMIPLQLQQIQKHETLPTFPAEPPAVQRSSNQLICRKATPKKPTMVRTTAKRKVCTCTANEPPPTIYSYSLWNFNFRFSQQRDRKHERGCRLYGIQKATKTEVETQLPVMVAWLCRYVTLTCIDLELGTSNPGIGVRFKNYVPKSQCLVSQELHRMVQDIDIKCADHAIERIESSRRAIFSLYRERKSSPNDRDESGISHASVLAEMVIELVRNNLFRFCAINDSVVVATLGLLGELMEACHSTDEIIRLQVDHLLEFMSLIQPQRQWIGSEPWSRSWLGTEEHRVITWLARAFQLELRNNVVGIPQYYLFEVISHEMEILAGLDFAPIVNAILTKSLAGLESCIAQSPDSVKEVVAGSTTLHLAITWPQGLERLLDTEARDLINHGEFHSTPLEWAVQCAESESVVLLMKAGCMIDLDHPYCALDCIDSPKCAVAMASSLAERRRQLLALAEKELGVLPDLASSAVVDAKTPYLCAALADANVDVPAPLRVGPSYTSIYHAKALNPIYFPVFFEHGFWDVASHSAEGLAPIMLHRPWSFFPHRYGYGYLMADDVLGVLPWLREHGFLDQTPTRGTIDNLNLTATGWHYIAAMFAWCSLDAKDVPSIDPCWELTEHLSRTVDRDGCSCWCTSECKGCSPLANLWKVRAEGSHRHSRNRSIRHPIARHVFLHHGNVTAHIADKRSPSVFLDLIRLLTFEALEMRHTCCSYEKRGSHSMFLVVPDEDKQRDIRADEVEQQSAELLEALMEEFIDHLNTGNFSPKAFDNFIWGFWRHRASKLFIVDADAVNDMEGGLEKVQTHMFPQRVLNLLGDDFDFLRYGYDETGEGGDADCEDEDDEDEKQDGRHENGEVQDEEKRSGGHHDEDCADVNKDEEFDDVPGPCPGCNNGHWGSTDSDSTDPDSTDPDSTDSDSD